MSVHFFNEGSNFKIEGKRVLKNWIKYIVLQEGKSVGNINFIFSNDEYVLEINKVYLNHDYFTDIITFNYNQGTILNGDIYISVDTVRGNAELYNVTFEFEIQRVIIHGILHLVGFDDTTDALKSEMKEQEDKALTLLITKFLTK